MAIFTFCRFFLGDEARAQEATLEAFLAYLRRGLALDRRKLPDLLVWYALDVAKEHCFPHRPRAAGSQNLERALLFLPCDQRAVFILRNVLGLKDRSLATATGLPPEQVRELWVRSLMGIRKLLTKDFSKERTQCSQLDSLRRA